MKALQYRRSVPRYLLAKLLGPRIKALYTSRLSPLVLREVPEPELPTQRWVRVAPRLAGICGSDLATVRASGSPYLAPVTSLPFVMGHEVVGHVTQIGAEVTGLSVGDRVVLHPALGCRVRGIEPLCDACREGRDALCENVTRGDISNGIQTGYCRDTGGGFGGSFVAHESQLYRVPEALEDRVAVLTEPFACALHGAMRVSLEQEDVALVIGCGAMGLLTIAALRALGCRARIIAAARHDHQKKLALSLGADALVETGGSTRERYAQWAKTLGAQVLKPELGKPTVIGGACATFDCVGSSGSIDDGVRFTRGGGTFVLIGMPGVPSGVDFTPLWYKELTIRAAYAYGPERHAGGVRETFDIALDLMRTWGPRLRPLVFEPFALEDFRAAFASALDVGRSGAVKVVFAISGA